MRQLIRSIILWALGADTPREHDAAGMDKAARQLRGLE
jgi:hypothetical protein